MLGDHEFANPTTLYTRNLQNFSRNSIINCSFLGSEGDPLLQINSNGILLENNRILWSDWSTVSAVPCWPSDLASGPLLKKCDLFIKLWERVFEANRIT